MRSVASKGLVDLAYKAFIASQECCICAIRRSRLTKAIRAKGLSQLSRTEVAHVGMRGLSQKCDDRCTIPLCGLHHRVGREAHHKLGKLFFEHHGTDKDALVKFYNEKYEKGKAA